MKIFQKRYTWAVCMMLAASNVLTHAKNDASGTGTVSNSQTSCDISDDKIRDRLDAISDRLNEILDRLDKMKIRDQIRDRLDKMKKAILSNDPHKMAEMFDFSEKCTIEPGVPLKERKHLAEPCPPEHLKEAFLWNREGKSDYISKEEFIDRYKEIITPEIKKAIKNATFQNDDNVGYRGYMISNGLIWVDPDRGIKTINA